MFYTAPLFATPLLQSPLQRARRARRAKRSRRGKTESGRVETECKEIYPLKAEEKLVGGTEGLRHWGRLP